MSFLNFDASKYIQQVQEEKQNLSSSKKSSNIYRFPVDKKTRIRLLPNPTDVQLHPYIPLYFYEWTGIIENGRELKILSPDSYGKEDPIKDLTQKIGNGEIESFNNLDFRVRSNFLRSFTVTTKYYWPFMIRGINRIYYWECSQKLHDRIKDLYIKEGKVAFANDGFDIMVWKEKFEIDGRNGKEQRTRQEIGFAEFCDWGKTDEQMIDFLKTAPKLLGEFRRYKPEELQEIFNKVLHRHNIIDNTSNKQKEEVKYEEDVYTVTDDAEIKEENTNEIEFLNTEKSPQDEMKDKVSNMFGDIDFQ